MRSATSGGVRLARIGRLFSTAPPKPAAPAAAAAAAPAGASAAPPPPPPQPVFEIKYSGRSQPTFNLETPAGLTVEGARELQHTANLPRDALAGQVARIQRSTPSAWTSGPAATRGWGIALRHTNKWSNQLMGWGSGDATAALPASVLQFPSAEAAVLFCERNGWAYEVEAEPTDRAPIALDPVGPGNNYNYNILPLAVLQGMKAAGLPRRAKAAFAHPSSPVATGVSTWVCWRHTDYGPDAWRPRNDKVKFDQSAWTGPEWRASKAVPPPGEEEEKH